MPLLDIEGDRDYLYVEAKKKDPKLKACRSAQVVGHKEIEMPSRDPVKAKGHWKARGQTDLAIRLQVEAGRIKSSES